MLQVNTDMIHDQVGQNTEYTSCKRNDDNGKDREIQMVIIVHLRPPKLDTAKFAGVSDDYNMTKSILSIRARAQKDLKTGKTAARPAKYRNLKFP